MEKTEQGHEERCFTHVEVYISPKCFIVSPIYVCRLGLLIFNLLFGWFVWKIGWLVWGFWFWGVCCVFYMFMCSGGAYLCPQMRSQLENVVFFSLCLSYHPITGTLSEPGGKQASEALLCPHYCQPSSGIINV